MSLGAGNPNKAHINNYLSERARLGKLYRNDRESSDKMWADAKLRGKIGCERANEIIKSIDDLRAKGF